jgi:Zn-dependent peptidase ImmA (M78 family)
MSRACRPRRRAQTAPACRSSSSTPTTRGERQRFTVAQELGHLYLDIPKQIDPEPLCHRFAGAFLLPGHMLQKEVGNYRHAISVRELFQLKHLFGVSAQAIAYRCRVSLQGPWHHQSTDAFKCVQAFWHERLEADRAESAAEGTAIPVRTAVHSLAEDLISEARASQLLQKTVREVVDSLDRPPEDPADGNAPRV